MPEIVVDLEWQSRKVLLYDAKTHSRSRQEDALVKGALALHQCIEQKFTGQWAVTHVPSGKRICRVRSDDDGICVVEQLHLLIPQLLEADGDSLVAGIPQGIRAWLEQVNSQYRYVEPSLEASPELTEEVK